MAQRKKSAATRRGKAVKHRNARGRAQAAKGKTTKHSFAKAAPRKRSAKAKTKRTVAKPVTPKKAAPQKQQGELPIEVIKVEQVEEPAPGVVVVTEYQSVRVRRTPATTAPDGPKKSAGIPESNGK